MADDIGFSKGDEGGPLPLQVRQAVRGFGQRGSGFGQARGLRSIWHLRPRPGVFDLAA